MALGRAGKGLLGPLLLAHSVVYLITFGLAGWSLDKCIDGEQDYPHLGGNPSTSFMIIFALMGGAIGGCSVVSGLMHLLAWRTDSLAAASSLAIVSCGLTALIFGLVFKEVSLGKGSGKRLEGFIIISLLSQVLYVGLLHAGMFNSLGPSYQSQEKGGIAMLWHIKHNKTTAPAVF